VYSSFVIAFVVGVGTGSSLFVAAFYARAWRIVRHGERLSPKRIFVKLPEALNSNKLVGPNEKGLQFFVTSPELAQPD
jgi:hypothetical protein